MAYSTNEPDPVLDVYQDEPDLLADFDELAKPMGALSSNSFAPSARYDRIRSWLRCISDPELSEVTGLPIEDGKIQLPPPPPIQDSCGLIEHLGGFMIDGVIVTQPDYTDEQLLEAMLLDIDWGEDDAGGPSNQGV
jgi:hypothetical protein